MADMSDDRVKVIAGEVVMEKLKGLQSKDVCEEKHAEVERMSERIDKIYTMLFTLLGTVVVNIAIQVYRMALDGK